MDRCSSRPRAIALPPTQRLPPAAPASSASLPPTSSTCRPRSRTSARPTSSSRRPASISPRPGGRTSTPGSRGRRWPPRSWSGSPRFASASTPSRARPTFAVSSLRAPTKWGPSATEAIPTTPATAALGSRATATDAWTSLRRAPRQRRLRRHRRLLPRRRPRRRRRLRPRRCHRYCRCRRRPTPLRPSCARTP